MDIYIWLFLLLSGCCHGMAELVTCPSVCRCHPEGQIICQHRWFDGPLNPYFFRVVRNASVQLEIHMDHNKITHIPRRVFENFSSLRNLNLNDNLIQTLDPEAFFGLRQLRFLDMRNNSITELPIGLFVHQVQLVSLDLRQNSIFRMELETVSPMISLEQLSLGDNPLICDCELKYVLFWVTSRKVNEGDPPITCLVSHTVKRVPWNYLYHFCLASSGNSATRTTVISPLHITSALPSSEALSSKSGRISDPTEQTVITNDSLYNLTSVSLMPNASAIPTVENMTNVNNRTMSANGGHTIGIITFVVIATVVIILSVFGFVVCRRVQKRTRLKVMQFENAPSVPPPGRGQELLCENDDEEEGYEYVDLGKDTARYINLKQENGVLKE